MIEAKDKHIISCTGKTPIRRCGKFYWRSVANESTNTAICLPKIIISKVATARRRYFCYTIKSVMWHNDQL